jgi:hypothetical protein
MKKTLLFLLLIVALAMTLSAVPRNKVIIEIGTGTWCQYCPGAAMGADDLVTNGHQVAVIENHNGDPYATASSDARNTFYGINNFPTAYFDGGNASVGGNHTQSLYTSYVPKVNARMAIASHFTIEATGDEVEGNYSVNVVLNKTETDTNTNLRLHAVVTQSHIQQNWQGQTHLEFVERQMIPSQTGTTIDFGTQTQFTLPLTFTMNPAWVANDCELVLFLQNNTTKEILQGAKYSFPELFGAYAASATYLQFPNTYLTNSAVQTFTIHNYWNMTINGTMSTDNPDFTVAPNFTIPPYGSADYSVTFTPSLPIVRTGYLTINSNLPDQNVITLSLAGAGFNNAAPSIAEVQVIGVPVISIPLTATYLFTDPDNNTEGESIYRWFRISALPEPVLIAGATAITYTTVQADLGCQIAVEVTPKDQYGMPGTPVMSEPSDIIEILPAPRNLTSETSGDVNGEFNVTLNWLVPEPFSRSFRGYRVFRDDLIINTIMNPATTTFTDTYLWNGDYTYWVTSVFDLPNAQSAPSNVVSVHLGPIANDDNVISAVESVLIYPNPVSTSSNIVVKGKANSTVEANIFNTKGQRVDSITGRTNAEGVSNLSLTLNNKMIPGIYFVKIKTTKGNITRKMVVVD